MKDAVSPGGSCPVIDHLACKLPGELEPRVYDVYKAVTLTAGQLLQSQFVDLGNRDAPFHLASVAMRELSAGGRLSIRIYNARGFGISDEILRANTRLGAINSGMPVNPQLVWPVNSSLVFDLQNTGAGSGTWGLFFYGYKIFDRGKAPC